MTMTISPPDLLLSQDDLIAAGALDPIGFKSLPSVGVWIALPPQPLHAPHAAEDENNDEDLDPPDDMTMMMMQLRTFHAS